MVKVRRLNIVIEEFRLFLQHHSRCRFAIADEEGGKCPAGRWIRERVKAVPKGPLIDPDENFLGVFSHGAEYRYKDKDYGIGFPQWLIEFIEKFDHLGKSGETVSGAKALKLFNELRPPKKRK